MLTRQEKERLVIDLYNQGKTIREISKEVRMSFRDIGAILKKASGDKEENQDKVQSSLLSLSSQAYRLFSEGKAATEEWIQGMNLDLAAYERKYPKPLFNKGVRIENEDSIGHIVRETADRIVIFGSYDYRFDVPKSKIKEVGRNVILSLDYSELLKYKVDKSAPLPATETEEKLVV